MSEDYNPFLDHDEDIVADYGNEEGFTHVDPSSNVAPVVSRDSHNGLTNSARTGKDTSIDKEDSPAAVIQPEQKYTSLDEHASSMMSSVSIEEDKERFAALLGSDESQSSSLRDLFVKVDKPEKHVEGYVTYNVKTRTSRPDYEHPEYNVQRRYNDFIWLREKLEESCPTHVIPPLPEKFAFSKHFDRFQPDFLKTRQKALDKFLNRIAEHPVISFNEYLQKFLTAKAWEMTSARKQSTSAISKLSGSMKTAATSLMFKNRDSEFDHAMQFNASFQKKMQTFGMLSEEIAKERFYLLEDLEENASALHLWSDSENKLATPLKATAFAVDKNVEALKSILRVQDSRFAEPIREYILYCDAVKNSLKKRDQMQLEYEITTEELNKKRLEKQDIEGSDQPKSIATFFGKDPEKLKEERLEKLTEQIRDLMVESETYADRRERADHDMKADMERWQKSKRRDIKLLLLELAERHVKYYESCLNGWQDALDAVSGPRTATDSEED
eukprot:gene8103-8971_t